MATVRFADKLNERLSGTKYGAHIKEGIHYLVYLVFLFNVFLNISYSMASEFQTEKDLFFYKGVIWFLLLLFCVCKRRKKYISLICSVVGIVLCVAVFRYKGINADTYGPVYSKVLFLKWVIIVLSVSLLANDALLNGIASLNKRKNALFYIYVVTSVLAGILYKYEYIPLCFPVIAFIFSDIERKQWNKLRSSICISYYSVFFFLFTKSLILVPYNGEGGRYFGIFLTLGAGGMIAGGAFVCAIFLVVYNYRIHNDVKLSWIVPAILSIYPLYAVYRFGSRGSMAGIACVLIGLFVFMHNKGRKVILKRAMICLSIFAVLFLCIIAYSLYLNHENSLHPTSHSHIQVAIILLTNPYYQHTYFAGNPILNAIDCFSSGRLGIWAQALPQIGWLPNHTYTESPHNFFIDWFLKCGFPLGFLLMAWFVYYFIRCVRIWKEDSDLAFFPLLWHLYCFGTCMLLTNHWNMIIPFLLLVLQYPITNETIQIAE